MLSKNDLGYYLDTWASVQKQIKAMEQIPPRTYGELLSKQRKGKKKMGGK